MQESASLGTLSNSFVSLGFFGSFLHNGVVTSEFGEARVRNLLSHDDAVDQSLLFIDCSFLFAEFPLHGFELLGEEIVLLSDLFSGDG